MAMPIVKIALMAHAAGLPAYSTPGAAGMDIPSADDVVVYAGLHRVIRTGLRFEVPPHYELQIRSRSGMAANSMIFVMNSPGTLDSDYRGELMIILMNLGDKPFTVKRGMRIAQAVFCPVFIPQIRQVSEDGLEPSQRGEGRFGSTGA